MQNPEIRYRLLKIPSVSRILTQLHPIYTLTLFLLCVVVFLDAVSISGCAAD